MILQININPWALKFFACLRTIFFSLSSCKFLLIMAYIHFCFSKNEIFFLHYEGCRIDLYHHTALGIWLQSIKHSWSYPIQFYDLILVKGLNHFWYLLKFSNRISVSWSMNNIFCITSLIYSDSSICHFFY